MFRILVVEDDRNLNKLICTVLERNGYAAAGVGNPAEAFAAFESAQFDLIISDIMMPGMDGFDFAKEVRKDSATMPILFVTAKDDFASKQRGFSIGVDDYMVKPIDINELVLRVTALLRRSNIANAHRVTVGKTVADYDTLTVKREDALVVLPPKEFYILFKLLSYPDKIFTRSNLMDEFWGMDSESYERTVDVHITRLREKFKNNPDFSIVTVRGLGYKVVKNKGNVS